MAKSEAQSRANAKWRKKAYDRFDISVRKDVEINKNVIYHYAESKGISVNALIRDLLEERILNDKEFVI